MSLLQAAKQLVTEHIHAFDGCPMAELASTLSRHTSDDYRWRGLHPFGELQGSDTVCREFWEPLRRSFKHLQRRQDIFLAGHNLNHTDDAVWVCQMGHFLGLFDEAWLDIPPNHRLAHIRYAEFHQVANDKIVESALFIDLISVMRQAGQNPLPPQTGSTFMYPGPQTHDGLLHDPCPPEHGIETLNLIERMVADLSAANQRSVETGDNRIDPDIMLQSWHDDMLWYGPEGIGATYTIERYQHQHQYPFRYNLSGKTFNGHVARFAEGNYGCFFGWPNLTNTATGGFLGMTGSGTPADMRVVDVYRRSGDKLAENWVIIDLPHWLNMQGLDVLARMRQLLAYAK